MRGSSRHEDLEYPDEYTLYYLCAKEFGWTPNEVDNSPAHIVDWVISIAEIYNEVERESIG